MERSTRHFDAIAVDTTLWPVIIWTSPPQRVSDRASAEALSWLEELWRATPVGTKSFSLTDLSAMKEAAPASQRKLAAEFMDRNRELQRRASVGSAIVANSAFVRGIVTAVFWLRPSPLETRILATREEALLYGLDLLAKDCPPLPPHLLALRAKLAVA